MIKFLNTTSLYKRIIIILSSQILFILAAYLYISVSTHYQTQKYFNSALYKINNSIMYELNNQINTLESVTEYPILKMNQPISYNLYKNLDKNDSSAEYLAKMEYSFFQLATDIMLQSPSINQYYLFDVNGDKLGKKSVDIYTDNFSNVFNEIWFQKTLDNNGKLLLLNENDLPDLFANNISSMGTSKLFAARALISIHDFKPIGVILASIESNSILHIFQEQRLSTEQSLLIFSGNQSQIFGKNTSNTLTKNDFKNAENNLTVCIKKSENSFDYYYHISYDKTLDIYSVIKTPCNIISFFPGPSVTVILIIILLLIIISAIVSLKTTSLLHKSVNSLLLACDEIGKGNFAYRLLINSNDEFSYLMKSFNGMSSKIETLLKEKYENELSKRDLELQMLRAQINPHFIYNTLESMRMLAYSNSFFDFSEMCVLLAKVLRYSIDTSFNNTTVEKEINYLKDYIKLMDYRYHNSIEIVVNIDSRLYSYHMLNLLLQPLVENSLNHGNFSDLKNARIMILGYNINNMMIFKVIDNGSGISAIELDELKAYINNQNDAFSSIGLKNVQRRIQLFYGENYGLTLESQKGNGTSVTMTLPLLKYNDGGDKHNV